MTSMTSILKARYDNMSECVFCKIVNKEIPAKVVYEDERTMAFHDIAPQARVHILIIPKKHIPTMMDATEADLPLIADIHAAIQKVARQIGVAESGFRLINNCGQGGGQEVFHIHYHLLGGQKLGPKIV
jgi:histidine triad (HIT) family protein